MSELKQALLEELLSSQDLLTWSPYEHKFFGESSRAISFFGEVSSEKAELFISQLFHLEKLSDEDPITVYLNTEGGSSLSRSNVAAPNMVLSVNSTPTS